MSEDNKVDMRVYELGYHFVPSLPIEKVAEKVIFYKEMIQKMGGTIISEEAPREFSLAYEIRKVINNKKERFNNSYFGWIKFDLDTENVLSLKGALDLDTEIIRFLIIKTVKENTLVSKRIPREYTKKKYTPKTDEVVEEMNKEEVDKKLDEILAKE